MYLREYVHEKSCLWSFQKSGIRPVVNGSLYVEAIPRKENKIMLISMIGHLRCNSVCFGIYFTPTVINELNYNLKKKEYEKYFVYHRCNTCDLLAGRLLRLQRHRLNSHIAGYRYYFPVAGRYTGKECLMIETLGLPSLSSFFIEQEKDDSFYFST